jgi:hypothetical protein
VRGGLERRRHALVDLGRGDEGHEGGPLERKPPGERRRDEQSTREEEEEETASLDVAGLRGAERRTRESVSWACVCVCWVGGRAWVKRRPMVRMDAMLIATTSMIRVRYGKRACGAS